MVRAALTNKPTTEIEPEPSPRSVENLSQERVPASQRLGPRVPPPIDNQVEGEHPPATVAKRKPGRPVGSKTLSKATNLVQGGSSKKRKARQVAQSPRKRANSASPRNDSRTNVRRSTQSSRQADSSTSHLPGPVRIIPAIKKKTTDFHSPPSPLP